jgi:UDP-3-O-[3-hydroxymyristoyl] glucosamine N-acyltransferase
MKFENPIPVKQIAREYELEIKGDDSLLATGINEIHKVTPGDITFVDIEKYFDKSLGSEASIIILNKEVPCPEGKALLFSDNPFAIYNDIVIKNRPFQALTAVISDSASIHPSTIIEPNAIIGDHVTIGANCHIQANSTIYSHCIIGNNVKIHSGAIIGTDAFYYKKVEEKYIQWNTCGRVIIEDDVVIGAGCTINKGVSGDTIIGQGSKLDSQIHIGHGAQVGKNCLFAAQVGIGGKTIIEDGVVLYGQVGVAQNLRIGAGAVVFAKSGVSKDLEGGKIYFGIPVSEVHEKYKELAAARMLPDLLKKFK